MTTKRSGARKPARRYHISELVLAITCPACRLYMGQCRDEDTRQTALRTHATSCTAQPTQGA